MSFGKTFWHAVRDAVGLDEAVTQTPQRERDALCRHVAGGRRVVETVVYEGVTTAVLVAIKGGEGGGLYAVDPFPAGRAGILLGELIARKHMHRSFVKQLSTEACRALHGDFASCSSKVSTKPAQVCVVRNNTAFKSAFTDLEPA